MIRTSPFFPRSGPGKSTSFQGLHAGCTHKCPTKATRAAASRKPGDVNKPQLRHSYCSLIWSCHQSGGPQSTATPSHSIELSPKDCPAPTSQALQQPQAVGGQRLSYLRFRRETCGTKVLDSYSGHMTSPGVRSRLRKPFHTILLLCCICHFRFN